jgi:glycosyltransferase involved in cell wall biosynthesis
MPERLPLFARSVAAYCAQTHADKELVVVTDGPREKASPLIAHVASLARRDIRFVHSDERLSLGALRNRSVAEADGDLLCQWDDDDLHHPQRLERQLRVLLGSDAACVYLEETMQLFAQTGLLYWLNWHATETRAHPGTLLCRRSSQPRYPEEGEVADWGEDTAVCLQLQKVPGFTTLAQQPFLYVYVTHDSNKFPRAHHEMLAEKLAISKGLLARREHALREGLAAFDFGSDEIVVQGSNGAAFSLNDSVSS